MQTIQSKDMIFLIFIILKRLLFFQDEIVAQYVLIGYDLLIGISDYQLVGKVMPESLKSALPIMEQVEEELTMLLGNENQDSYGRL